ncbi:nuclear transport factor 2 family protein [Sphingosinicella sp. CPCC 101087]|uniref:nuclear transport factor 2 family protein n=1 Tax=Sphingosinicella sp. CPCC 101087 TaxID=2497754 RepID=UPI0013EC3AB1|nr:nuclear transport factor 2 family protein [Sphingosinicella sp. CPCC 101087]
MKRLTPGLLVLLAWTMPALAQSTAAVPVLTADAKVFAPSPDPDVLAGSLRNPEDLSPVSAVLERTEVGDLIVAVVRLAREGRDEGYGLRLYRLQDGRATHVWTLIEVAERDRAVEAGSIQVARTFIETNNRGDADAFLALFHPQARNFRSSGDPNRIGDRPSRTLVDAASRERFYRTLFGNEQQAQVTANAVIALGDLVVSHDLARLPNGTSVDGLSVYRVRDGRITHDWYVYSELRE